MTTKVTVDAHAGWPVKVIFLDQVSEKETMTIVKPYTTQDFHVWDGRMITIIEMKGRVEKND
jgi:hypothetical protein